MAPGPMDEKLIIDFSKFENCPECQIADPGVFYSNPTGGWATHAEMGRLGHCPTAKIPEDLSPMQWACDSCGEKVEGIRREPPEDWQCSFEIPLSLESFDAVLCPDCRKEASRMWVEICNTFECSVISWRREFGQ